MSVLIVIEMLYLFHLLVNFGNFKTSKHPHLFFPLFRFLVQNVKACETTRQHVKTATTSLHESAKELERTELKKLYGQSDKKNSLYHMFESFKRMAILENPG